MRSGSLCALLWRLLSWCNHKQIGLRARHISGCLNVVADNLSSNIQVIQTEWYLLQVFDTLLKVDLFSTSFNQNLPKFVSLIPDHRAWRVDSLSVHWDELYVFDFPC